MYVRQADGSLALIRPAIGEPSNINELRERFTEGEFAQATDFYSSIYAPREPVSVSGSHWGEVKKLYRNPE